MSSRTVDHAHRVLDTDESSGVQFGSAQAGQNQRGLASHEMAPIQFGRDLDREVDVLNGFGDRFGIGHGGQQIAAQCHQQFHF